jgi:AcrR family transcriptional regulator
MSSDLNSVKSSYHHGALRPALIAAAEAVIAERGLDRFSLRETARRAGVSPAAPAHHFKDTRGLLTAIAAAAFRELGDALETAGAGARDRESRMRAQGLAYVDFALRQPARFSLMWREPLLDRDDPDYAEAAKRAFLLLDRAVRGEEAAGAPHDPAVAPSLAAWSIVHGFARLALDGAFGGEPDAPRRAAEAMLPRVLDHLHV